MKNCIALGLLIATNAFAEVDPNFIQVKDLPQEVTKGALIHQRSNNDTLTIAVEALIEDAMKDPTAEQNCMAKVGEQISSWILKIKNIPFYERYSISAKFKCLNPKLTGAIASNKAEAFVRLTQAYSSKVLCYQHYEPVCINDRLLSYKTIHTCEIENMETNQIKAIVDISDEDGQGKIEGARDLMDMLPVYKDSRRDDTPPARNCEAHVFGKLKGLTRKAAYVMCLQRFVGPPHCTVSGMIKPD